MIRRLTTCSLTLLLLAEIASAAPPRLEELAGTRQLCPTLENMPAICNFYGGLAAGRNVLSIESLTLPPLSQGGETARLTHIPLTTSHVHADYLIIT